MPVPLGYRETATESRVIEAVWSAAARPDAPGVIAHVVLPDGCLDLVFRHRRDTAGRVEVAALVAVGPAGRAQTVPVLPGEAFVGLRFRPGWGGACLGVRAGELAGRAAAAQDVAPWLAAIERRLAGTRTSAEAAAALTDAGERLAPAARAPERRALEAVRLLRASGGRIDAGEAARSLGVSPRTLRREVGEAVGLGPKALARVFRFRRALALESGYADQAHMARESRALGGFAPSRSLAPPAA